ncbi:MAG: hypothetical protein HKN82_15460 [Akkermansiaceae bacterium]|nr:hypothetical protein [Akkermansiaceae bacterium]
MRTPSGSRTGCRATGTICPRRWFVVLVAILTLAGVPGGVGRAAAAGEGLVLTTTERLAVTHRDFLDSRREQLRSHADPYQTPARARVLEEYPEPWEAERYPWHYGIHATVFWAGERPTKRNPTPNSASAWDPNWAENFGGLDHPTAREGYLPRGFRPEMNAFYVALPYNDIGPQGRHKPDASDVVPWFWRAYKGPTVSVCEDRWIMLHHNKRICYAQWKDVGPWATDDWAYVFKGWKPQANPNRNAGIDISPAVRDFLGLPGNGSVDWKFVEDYEVPAGPWAAWMEGSQRAGPLFSGP